MHLFMLIKLSFASVLKTLFSKMKYVENTLIWCTTDTINCSAEQHGIENQLIVYYNP